MMPSYESMLASVYKSILKPGDVAIDIGAHIGLHTFPIAEAVGVEGRVFCFEPLPKQFGILSGLIKERLLSGGGVADDIKAYNIALGDSEGEASFTVVPDFPEFSGFKERTYHSNEIKREIIEVKVMMLDSFKDEIGKVRYIKVDAEGGELTILRGAIELISESKPIVSFELGDAALVNYPYTSADYYDYFYDLGYVIYSIFGIPLSKNEFVDMSRQQFFWDYIAAHKDETFPKDHNNVRVLINQLWSARESTEPEMCSDFISDKAAKLISEANQSAARERDIANAEREKNKLIINSHSWKITAPLRAIKSKIFRG
ncbi:FkbM family methyltransferase [Yersinia enterocolitica]